MLQLVYQRVRIQPGLFDDVNHPPGFLLCQKMTSIAQLAGFLSPNWQHLCLRNFLTTVRAAQLTGITCADFG